MGPEEAKTTSHAYKPTEGVRLTCDAKTAAGFLPAKRLGLGAVFRRAQALQSFIPDACLPAA
jgi:hypothetical protein